MRRARPDADQPTLALIPPPPAVSDHTPAARLMRAAVPLLAALERGEALVDGPRILARLLDRHPLIGAPDRPS